MSEIEGEIPVCEAFPSGSDVAADRYIDYFFRVEKTEEEGEIDRTADRGRRMTDSLFEEYVTGLFKDVPCYLYEGLLGAFVVGVIVVLAVKGARDGWRWSAGLLLVEYVVLIYCSTVVFRKTGSESGFDLTPFWSYGVIVSGEDYRLLPENVMNVVVFMPAGVLLGTAFRSMTWWKALLVGVGISVSIEAMQFFLKRGFAETDDVMHNTVGSLMGFGIYKLVRYGYKRLGKKSLAIL